MFTQSQLITTSKIFFAFVLILAIQFQANASEYVCSPKVVKLDANYGMAMISISGPSASYFTKFVVFRDGKETKDIVINAHAKPKNSENLLSIIISVPRRDLPKGTYKVKAGKESASIELPLYLDIISISTNKNPDTKLANYIELGKYKNLNVYQALKANNNKTTGFTNGPGLSFTSAEVRRNMMLDAFAATIAATNPKVKDWFPKTIGAIDGTLVLAGEKLDQIVEVKIGNTVLEIVSTNGPVNQNMLMETMVLKLPAGPIEGKLTYKGRNFNGYFSIENDYRTVDQTGPEWPATRSTYLGAANVFTGSSMLATLNNGRADAMRMTQHSFLIEYVPGNILNSSMFKDSISAFHNKAREIVGAGAAYSFADASGNRGFFGNAIVVSFQKIIFDTNPTPTLTVRSIDFDINTESYINTASAQNNILKRTTKCTLEWNSLKEYTISNTSSLERLYTFYNTYALGTVSDVSTNLDGSGAVIVGQTTEGADIAFRLASGPFGTAATWVSRPFRMPHGWLVNSVTWSEKRDYTDPNVMGFSGVDGRTSPDQLALMGWDGINLLNPFDSQCGGGGTAYFPYWDKGARYNAWRSPTEIRKIVATGTISGKGITDNTNHEPISFGIEPIASTQRVATSCTFGPPTTGLESTYGQFVKAAMVHLRCNSNIDNSVRVLFKMDEMKFLGPHNGNLNEMLSSIYIYDMSTIRGESGGNIIDIGGAGQIVRSLEYPPSQLNRYTGYNVDYYMDKLRP